ncbi:unnamed protein product [Spirodela intermedia]|uniref:TLDc domain-containing protein n=1 Tax=Spirodela intermedia TaxID=51605 RepID=A0ABN7EA60_SPIIN|nr:unnamed protein product [Spirodela intermedia]
MAAAAAAAAAARPILNGFFNPSSGVGAAGGRRSQQRPELKYHKSTSPFPRLSSPRRTLKELRCCYRATMDGFSATAFHESCDFRGPCVVVGYTEEDSVQVRGLQPGGLSSTDDYYDTFEAFLFYWAHPGGAADSTPVIPPRWAQRRRPLRLREGRPPVRADGLLIGPPLSPVMGVFTGPTPAPGAGDLRRAKSRLGLSYAKSPTGSPSLFGDDRGPRWRRCRSSAAPESPPSTDNK